MVSPFFASSIHRSSKHSGKNRCYFCSGDTIVWREGIFFRFPIRIVSHESKFTRLNDKSLQFCVHFVQIREECTIHTVFRNQVRHRHLREQYRNLRHFCSGYFIIRPEISIGFHRSKAVFSSSVIYLRTTYVVYHSTVNRSCSTCRRTLWFLWRFWRGSTCSIIVTRTEISVRTVIFDQLTSSTSGST